VTQLHFNNVSFFGMIICLFDSHSFQVFFKTGPFHFFEIKLIWNLVDFNHIECNISGFVWKHLCGKKDSLALKDKEFIRKPHNSGFSVDTIQTLMLNLGLHLRSQIQKKSEYSWIDTPQLRLLDMVPFCILT